MKQISQMRLSKIAMLLLISCLNSQYLCDLKSQKSNDWLTASSGSPNSMDFEGAWIKGYCGKGVNVGIIDSYVEVDHPDLKNAFDRTLFKGFDYNYGEEINYGVKNHGTNMVSVIAGSHKTFLCNKGLAPSAKIALISIEFGTNVLDSAEAASIEHRREDIDIYVMSWGPADDGKTIDGPGQQFKRALKAGTEYGRNGLGNIFIVASGNGGENYDDCNCDGYVANLYTISVGSFMSSGKKPAYQEHCAAMLVSVPDLYKHFTTGTTGKKCTNKFSGTSASAPVIASAIALALDANPLLTWRDVQHLLVYSASIPENFKEKVYTNAAGLQCNIYGLEVLTEISKQIPFEVN